MIHINTWRPDTCGCELLYSWDDATPEDQRVHTPVTEFVDGDGKTHKAKCCQHHQIANADTHPAKARQHHDTVLEENQRKNKVLSDILAAKPDAEVDWSFDTGRNLNATLKGQQLTAGDKAAVRALIAAKHQKVTIR